MTEDFKKGLATGIAIGGVTIIKQGGAYINVKKITPLQKTLKPIEYIANHTISTFEAKTVLTKVFANEKQVEIHIT